VLQLGDDYPQRFVVLRGYAGVGKTAVLRTLAARGHRVLDLEALAGHRGSAFGRVGLPAQPSPQSFEARIAALVRAAPDARTYTEFEGASLGRLALPPALACALGAADYVLLRDTTERRIARIVAMYRKEPRADLIEAVARLRPRLGASADRAQAALLQGDIAGAVAAVLGYYDRAYAHHLDSCPGRALAVIDVGDRPLDEIADQCAACPNAVV
jgi:tRNA 2-selenouridine synthase